MGWALGFMPLAVFAVQYGILFALLKSGRAGLYLDAPLGLLAVACSVVGLVIVYLGTQDIALAAGYLVVRWIEGYIAAAILTPAILLSVAASGHPTIPHPIVNAPELSGGAAQTSGGGSAQAVSVQNAQGIGLVITGHKLVIAMPSELTVSGQLVNTVRSTAYVHCIPVHGSGYSLPPESPKPGADSLVWRVSRHQEPIQTCYGTVTLAHGGSPSVNANTSMYGFNLLPWTTSSR